MLQQLHHPSSRTVNRRPWPASVPCSKAVRLHARSRVVSRAWDSGEETRWQLPDVQQQHHQQLPQDPHTTLQQVLDVVRTRNLDGMLEFCSDEVIDKLLALKKQSGWVHRGARGLPLCSSADVEQICRVSFMWREPQWQEGCWARASCRDAPVLGTTVALLCSCSGQRW